MSYKPHTSHLSHHAGQPDQVDQSHHMQDQQPSFDSAKLKIQNWQNLNDFQDSEMVIESSSDQMKNESHSNHSFIETTKKALGEFNEIKQSQSRRSIKFQDASVQYQVKHEDFDIPSPESSNYKIKKIRKPRKNKRRVAKTHFIIAQPHFPIKRSRDQCGMNSLKNISSSVCEFVQKVQKISYPQLFNKFVNENGNESKNLKRRMYDVINVLSSVKIIRKKGHMLSKKNYKLASQNQNNSDVQDTADSKMVKMKKLKQQVEEKQERIKQKREMLAELREKKQKLQRLCKRNQAWDKQIPETNMIKFPFICFVPQQNTTCQVNSQEAKLTFINVGNSDIQQVLTQTDAISHLSMKKKKKLPSKIPQVTFKQMKGISTTSLNAYEKKI